MSTSSPRAGGPDVRRGAPAGDGPARRASTAASRWSSSPSVTTSPPRPCAATCPTLERMGPGPPGPRRRRPAERAHRDRVRPRRARRRPHRAEGPDRRRGLDLLPPPDSTVIIDAGSTTIRLAELLPRDHWLTVVTHAVPDRRPPGRPARRSSCTCCRAGCAPPPRPRSAPRPSRRWPSSAPTSRSSAPTGITVDHGLSTPDRDEAATKRAIVAPAAPGRRARRLQQDRRRAHRPVRRARRRRRPRHRHGDASAPTTEPAFEAPDVEVVIA